MPEEPKGSEQLGIWEVNTVRATTFFGPDFDVHPEISWWNQVVGTEPEESRSRHNTGELLEVGVFEGKRLVLDIKPGRADWHLSALAGAPDELPVLLPTIGPFDEALTPFSKLTSKWLGICPPATRVAFGAILLMPVADREAGYTAISSLLPNLNIDPKNSLDFMYQINRPRASHSEIAGLQINRLSKWAVLASFMLQVGAGGGGMVQPARQPQFVARLELDMSSDAAFTGEFSSENIGSVYQELVRLGREIAESGDIP